MVVTWPFVICLICIPSSLGPAALGLRAYISGKSLMRPSGSGHTYQAMPSSLGPAALGLRAYISGKSPMRPSGFGHTYQANPSWPCYNHYVSLCSHSNNTSSMNPTSKCHTCSQGYKYKWLMPYGQGVGCLHLPTIFS